MNNLRIIITGGHLTPALATIEELKKNYKLQIFWFGEKHAMQTGIAETLEYKVIPQMGIPFYEIDTSKFNRKNLIKTFAESWKLPASFFKCIYLYHKIKPSVVLSFGSYVAVPPVLAAWVFRIPVVTHEQTTIPGLANRVIANFAKKIAITFPQSSKFFPSKKVVLTGNPTRAGFFTKARSKKSELPRILVTGGSRGSHIINMLVEKNLKALLAVSKVTHITGEGDFNRMKGQALVNYEVFESLSPSEFEKKIKSSDLVISRAGANTVLEIAALGIPAILIPIPWSGLGEQVENARALEKTGLAKVLDQDSSPEIFFKLVKIILKSPPSGEARKNAQKLANPQAAKSLAVLTISQWT